MQQKSDEDLKKEIAELEEKEKVLKASIKNMKEELSGEYKQALQS